jgi:hypothetical protein
LTLSVDCYRSVVFPIGCKALQARALQKIALLVPSLVETHTKLTDAETADFAVPIDFMLQVDYIADLTKT